jgi:hypothetical protein
MKAIVASTLQPTYLYSPTERMISKQLEYIPYLNPTNPSNKKIRPFGPILFITKLSV